MALIHNVNRLLTLCKATQNSSRRKLIVTCVTGSRAAIMQLSMTTATPAR